MYLAGKWREVNFDSFKFFLYIGFDGHDFLSVRVFSFVCFVVKGMSSFMYMIILPLCVFGVLS